MYSRSALTSFFQSYSLVELTHLWIRLSWETKENFSLPTDSLCKGAVEEKVQLYWYSTKNEIIFIAYEIQIIHRVNCNPA